MSFLLVVAARYDDIDILVVHVFELSVVFGEKLLYAAVSVAVFDYGESPVYYFSGRALKMEEILICHLSDNAFRCAAIL